MPRPRPRKQLLLKLGVLLLLGAIVNVAVAWACALWPNWPAEIGFDEADVRDSCWPVDVPPNWPRQPDHRSTAQCMFETSTLHQSQWTGNIDRNLAEIWSSDTGIPMRGLRLVELREWNNSILWDTNPIIGGALQRGLQPPSEVFGSGIAESRRIPLMPLWPGFAINTIFYSVMLWLLRFAPGKTRRFIRVRRGRCPACGYKIAQGVGPTCSECGHPVKPASPA